MPYQGGGLAAGLASGFTGWMQGKQEAEQRAYERKQEADRIAREKEREAFARLVQENAMKLANAQNQRASESALAGAVEKGYRPAGDQFEEFNNAIGIDSAALPTIQVNGQTMRKSAPSSAFGQFVAEQRTKRLDESAQAAKEQAARDAALAALPASARALAGALPTNAIQSAVGSQLTRQLTPREAPTARWEIRETSQGLVQINPQTGEVRPLTMGGQPVTGKASGSTAGGLTGEAAKRAEAMAAVDKELDAYRTMLNTQGPSVLNLRNADKTAIEAQYGNLQMALKEAYNLGVLNGPDLALIQKQITPPVGFSTLTKGKDAMLSQVDQVKASMGRRKQAMSEVYGSKAPMNDGPSTTTVPALDAATQAKIAKAKAAGYSDEEIRAYLTGKRP